MKPGTKMVKDTTSKIDHDITVKGTKQHTIAICYTESGGELIAIGSRNHVNRQVRMH